MIQKTEDAAREAAMPVGKKMIAAAMTAPKGCGVDNVEAVLVSGDDKDILAAHMRDIARETGEDFYARDAGNVDNSFCVVLLWAKNEPILLTNCGLCGFPDCAANRTAGAMCAFNITDLGIAVGSAVSVAADNRIDNRVLFSAGKGAARMNLFGMMLGLLRNSSFGIIKSVFFDRGDQDVSF